MKEEECMEIYEAYGGAVHGQKFASTLTRKLSISWRT